jgi:hypothetical protein
MSRHERLQRRPAEKDAAAVTAELAAQREYFAQAGPTQLTLTRSHGAPFLLVLNCQPSQLWWLWLCPWNRSWQAPCSTDTAKV